MGTYCEHNIPDIIHSTSNILFVEVFFDIVARSNQMQISYQGKTQYLTLNSLSIIGNLMWFIIDRYYVEET